MKLTRAIIFLTLAALLAGCMKEPDRSSYPRTDFVTLYYCAGFNNLSSSIQGNLNTLKSGDLPFKDSKHKLLTFTHFSKTDANFSDLTESHLVLLSKDFGTLHADTLLTIDRSRFATDPEVMTEVLQKVADLFPGAHYGLIVSSHGTGWLPAGKYNSGSIVQFSRHGATALPLYRYNNDPDLPKVKTFGAEVELRDNTKYSLEMTIQSMANAIPMHLDYLLFDACLMGGIEVAYEFREKADKIIFSPTEVLADGFDYSDISSLLSDNPNVEEFSRIYFDHYDSMGGINRSATITVVNSSCLGQLASVSRALFDKYRSGIAALNVNSNIQQYFRSNYHWFYDFEDILVKAGMSDDDKALLESALGPCITYKAATPSFLGVQIDSYSGLSMYLPGAGDAELDTFYRTLAWNKATNLVE